MIAMWYTARDAKAQRIIPLAGTIMKSLRKNIASGITVKVRVWKVTHPEPFLLAMKIIGNPMRIR